MELEYKSNIKSYLDKGYVFYNDPIQDIDTLLPTTKQDQNGAAKPMLAKLIQSVPKSTLAKVKEWYISKKIDGIRTELYFDSGVIKTASRGGGNYDYAFSHICNNPKLIEYFKLHPTLVLDGEGFVFGKTLQQISGCARLESGVLPFKLQYYVYDVVDTNLNFYERYKIIQAFKEELSLGFDPNKDFKDDELMIQILPQTLIPNDEKIM